MIVYYNGQWMRKSEVCISPDDRGFLFGDGTYEVVRIYHGKLFHFDAHLTRLARSLGEIQIRLDDLVSLQDTSQTLIQKNKLQDSDAALYIQITRGIAQRNHRFPEEIAPTVYVTASAVERPLQKMKEGVSVHLAPDRRWGRCDIKSTSLLANVLASQEGAIMGADETVFIRDHVLTEGTHTNFCAVFDGKVQTYPADCHILDGITREVVLNLCCALQIPVQETPIPVDCIHEAEEAFILGTTTEIMPVVQIDGQQIGSGKPGSITRRLQKSFTEQIEGFI